MESIKTELVDFTQAEEKRLLFLKERVLKTQEKADSLARTIAGALYEISEKKLFRIEAYTSIGVYANEMFGIAKSTTSEAISTFSRFKSETDPYRLGEEWEPFGWKSLTMLRKYSDEDIAVMGITPDCTNREIALSIKAFEDSKTAIENSDLEEKTVAEEKPVAEEKHIEEEAPLDVSRETFEEESPHSFPQTEIHIGAYESPEALIDILREHWEHILNSDYDLILTK